jgi:hypothetical protein
MDRAQMHSIITFLIVTGPVLSGLRIQQTVRIALTQVKLPVKQLDIHGQFAVPLKALAHLVLLIKTRINARKYWEFGPVTKIINFQKIVCS